jgi:hypothetical protein
MGSGSRWLVVVLLSALGAFVGGKDQLPAQRECHQDSDDAKKGPPAPLNNRKPFLQVRSADDQNALPPVSARRLHR